MPPKRMESEQISCVRGAGQHAFDHETRSREIAHKRSARNTDHMLLSETVLNKFRCRHDLQRKQSRLIGWPNYKITQQSNQDPLKWTFHFWTSVPPISPLPLPTNNLAPRCVQPHIAWWMTLPPLKSSTATWTTLSHPNTREPTN